MKREAKNICVAVTGVGAIIGQGVVSSLRDAGHDVRIIGIDRNERSPGTYKVDVFEKKPEASEDTPAYLGYWVDIVRKHNIRLIIPSLEIDMHFLNRNRAWFESLGVTLALNTPELIHETTDKWKFGERLAAIGYPVIPSMRPPHNWQEAVGVLGDPPLLLKPLQSNGSRGIVRLADERDFEYWRIRTTSEWMLQRIVGSAEEEYTVGVFGLGMGAVVGPIIFKRRLSSAGNTLEAVVVRNHPVIERAVELLCRSFNPVGPTNLQFRVEGETAYLLEINPRFSSSNSLRTAFGFNEAVMTVDYYLYGKIPTSPSILEGVAWRYAEDFVKYDDSHPV